MTFHPKMAYDAAFHKSARQLEDEGPPYVAARSDERDHVADGRGGGRDPGRHRAIRDRSSPVARGPRIRKAQPAPARAK